MQISIVANFESTDVWVSDFSTIWKFENLYAEWESLPSTSFFFHTNLVDCFNIKIAARLGYTWIEVKF